MKIVLRFGGMPPQKGPTGYIAHPYTTDMHKLIEIQKKSGIARCRTEQTRRKALEEYLRASKMTLKDYQDLEVRASTPFFRNKDGHIIIPSDRMYACLVNASAEAPSRIKIDGIRTKLYVSDFVTTKKEPDGTWERHAVVTNAQGKLSNQRGFRSNQYITNFEATGEIDHDPELVKPEAILALVDFAGRDIGCGASRKMAWGRFVRDGLPPKAVS